MQKLRRNEVNVLGDFNVNVDLLFFLNEFRLGSARSATFILLLASLGPRSFISGSKVDLSTVLQMYNRHEFHHMFPRSLPTLQGKPKNAINCLANMCILSRADNNKIKNAPPSKYRELMPSEDTVLYEVLEAACTSPTLFSDDFEKFLVDRMNRLIRKSCELVGIPLSGQVTGMDFGTGPAFVTSVKKFEYNSIGETLLPE